MSSSLLTATHSGGEMERRMILIHRFSFSSSQARHLNIIVPPISSSSPENLIRNNSSSSSSSNNTRAAAAFPHFPTKPFPLLLCRCSFSSSNGPRIGRPQRSRASAAGWFSGFDGGRSSKEPDIVKAGDPVLHEAARELSVDEIASERVQKMIDGMIGAMRKAPGVGLAAPQIGIPLQIIVLEDTKEYISYAPSKEIETQDRRPFDLLVIVNPKLKNKGNKTALFFEGCLSVDGFRAVVERHLEVEVTGLDRDGRYIKVDATGWQARILQHECDHLDGTIYVDKIVPRTFRTVENLDLPLPAGCPQLGVRELQSST